MMASRHGSGQVRDGGAVELDDTSASSADQVVVRFLAVGVLISDLIVAELDGFDDPAADQQGQCAVDRGLRDALAAGSEVQEQLLGFEMRVVLHDAMQNGAALGRIPQAAAVEVFTEEPLGGP